jgi:hypothetical protein
MTKTRNIPQKRPKIKKAEPAGKPIAPASNVTRDLVDVSMFVEGEFACT